jgi:hypothetical protein
MDALRDKPDDKASCVIDVSRRGNQGRRRRNENDENWQKKSA